MMRKIMKKGNWVGGISLLVGLMVIFSGCATGQKATSKEDQANVQQPVKLRSITSVQTAEDNNTVKVSITGDQSLVYTSVKQPFPLGVILYFPDTKVDNVNIPNVKDNDIVASIAASEKNEKQHTSKIEITLKKDAHYEVARNGDTLEVSFSKTMAQASNEPANAQAQSMETPVSSGQSSVAASSDTTNTGGIDLHSIYANKGDKGVTVNVRANNEITNYKYFTFDNPPRIVFDIYDVNSPYDSEQIIPVNTKWVKRIRHFSYPDRLRLVLDTEKPFLNDFSSNPTENGLVIKVGGGKDATAIAKEIAERSVMSQNVAQKATEKDLAWLNRIDFSTDANGKSTIIIGTSRIVDYHVTKIEAKWLHLKLLNTKVPVYRQRPIITTRFNSAINRIIPVQSKVDKNTTIVSIELREAVPYYTDQSQNLLQINFDPSSVPPSTLDAAKLPPWKKVLAQTAKTVAIQKSSEPGEALLYGEKKAYTGEKIALDFYETDIKNVFRILREVSGKNYAIDKDVTGKVTLTLEKPVPWDQILDLILKMNQLGMTMEGDIIRIATLETLEKEQELRRKALVAKEVAKLTVKYTEPLITEYITINYSSAQKEILPHLEKVMTKGRGSLSVDTRTNVIIMTDTADKIKKAKEIVRKLDKVTPQVLIEARIVEATANFSRDIGTDWALGSGVQSTGQLDSNLVSSSNVSNNLNNRVGIGPQRGLSQIGGTYGYNMAMNFPVAASGSVGFNFTRIAGTPLLLNAKLYAMEEDGEGKIISTPKVLTIDNKKATISQGFEYPYLERASDGGVSVKFKTIEMKLEVTPHITPDNRISILVKIKKEDIYTETAEAPALQKKEAETELLINDGDTIVIGGVIKSNLVLSNRGLPFLKDIPFLGWLFKSKSKSQSKEELLIFLTPKIVHLDQRNV